MVGDQMLGAGLWSVDCGVRAAAWLVAEVVPALSAGVGGEEKCE